MLLFYFNCMYKSIKSSYKAFFCVEIAFGQNNTGLDIQSWIFLKHIHLTSTEKQVLTTYTNLLCFCFLETTPVLAPNVWANKNLH